MKKIIILISLMFFIACGQKKDKKQLVLIDTASGANFQLFFKQEVIPKIKKELGIDVQYVVGSEPEIRERLKAWNDAKDGDMHLVFLKPQGLHNMIESKISLSKITEENVPNINMIAKEYREFSQGIALNMEAIPFWYSVSAILYNSEKIKNPPKSWDEFYERRQEFEGHIGMIRPDAKSAGGREFIYTFLNVNGVDFSQPFDGLQNSEEWRDAIEKFRIFSKSFYKPLASEPPVLFQQFKSGEVWITEYAIDYTLWSRDKGLLPKSIKALNFEEGNTDGGSFLYIIPEKISDEKKYLAYQVLDYLLSEKIPNSFAYKDVAVSSCRCNR